MAWLNGTVLKQCLRVGFQKPVKLTEMTSWSTKKKRSTNGFPLFSLTILLKRKLQALSVIIGKKLKKLEYKSVVMLPSLTVVVVSRKDILVFDTSCVNLIDGWILLACSKNSPSSLTP
jgi:hypothetical protein